MKIKFYRSLAEIGEPLWSSVVTTDYPFLNYHFFFALENAADLSGATLTESNASEEIANHSTSNFVACNRKSGWQPYHVVVFQQHEDGTPDTAIALMPNYIKYHSYGEYIFDWAWAEAYHRHGLDYYPKMYSAIPYSPVTGERIAIAKSHTHSKTRKLILSKISKAIKDECSKLKLSSFHLLFSEKHLSDELNTHELIQRHSFQYHWLNENNKGQPFTSFENFLSALKSRKRKEIKKERQRVSDAGIVFQQLSGDAIKDSHWRVFYQFYQRTYAKRSGHGGYLPQAFFEQLGETLSDKLLLVLALKNGEIIAGALNLFSSSTLFGRYWGCVEDAEFLHFETCYYQGIEFCISNGLKKFDAGAQGEHKIQRGFTPVSTWSNHWVAHDNFRNAIHDFINEEQKQNLLYMEQAKEMLPFAQSNETIANTLK